MRKTRIKEKVVDEHVLYVYEQTQEDIDNARTIRFWICKEDIWAVAIAKESIIGDSIQKRKKHMSFCQGNIENCEAKEVLCPLCRDVMACSEHGHVDAGAMRDCPYEVRPAEEVGCGLKQNHACH